MNDNDTQASQLKDGHNVCQSNEKFYIYIANKQHIATFW